MANTIRLLPDRCNNENILPDAKKAYATIRKLKPTPVQTQIFTGHTGIAEYLHRFKLLQSPSCECDADKIESVWHIILECPRYEVARYDLEHKIETKLENENARNNGEPRKRVEFCHSQRKPSEATSRHRSMNRKRNEETPPTAPTSAPTQNPKRILKTKLQHCARRQRKECYVAQKQQESLGYEQGSGTVHGRKHGKARNRLWKPMGSSVSLSPGLANLINGSTSKTILKRKTFDSLEQLVIEGKVLHKLSESEQATPRVISIDSMSVGYEKAMSKIILKHSSLRETQDRNLGTSCQGPRRNEARSVSESNQLKRRQKPRSERASPRATPETGKNWKLLRAFNAGIATKLKAFTSKSECSTTEDKEKPRHLKR
ncbi:hypothetical protein EVAR_53197_1 [Eumeta japonica]|uniref:Retrovirus-related Pol polyprotein from type-1 retrotransposable element R1 4 n=1 Tax=Eumeta variegata TaxID=151549 RepID=A0A4C1Z0B9_EUMVA|nr:hypothetical protein EVAR_53197_1 [Eumeta japonica]